MSEQPNEGWERARQTTARDRHWRGVHELLRTTEHEERQRAEFPEGADTPEGISRRGFLKLLSASAAMAGATACEQPLERILPYTDQPPEVTPGIPQYYATSMVVGGYATGLLVESHSGRPVKVEGHPEHPASLGAAGVYEQASALQLYDPERARVIRHAGEPADWESFVAAMDPAGFGMGEGLRFLLEPTSSPLLLHLLARIRERYPAARVHFHAPLSADPSWAGSQLVFGRSLQAHYDFAEAEVILSLDADFLSSMPFHLRHARAWAEQRRLPNPSAEMNRMYIAEGMLSVTGSAADHRLRVRPSEVHAVAVAVLVELIRAHGVRPGPLPPEVDDALEHGREPAAAGVWVRAVARDLAEHRGRGVVVAGERQTPEVHALAHLLNAALDNVGRTVHLTEPVLAETGAPESTLEALATDIQAGTVQTLVVLGANPAYTAPADLEFAERLSAIPNTVCLDLYETETARLCDWFIPSLHYLETWGDARAYDGTVSFVQPLIRPLYESNRAGSQVLAAFLGKGASTPYELLVEFWRGQSPAEFEEWWEEALHMGFLPGTEAPRVEAAPRWSVLPALLRPAPAAPQGVEAVFWQSPSVYDGRFANNAWLLEFPDPMTKLSWDNAAIVSPGTAVELGVEQGDVMELEHAGRTVRAPAFVLPGVADGVVVLPLGYGHDWGDLLGSGIGFNAYPLRTLEAPYFARDLRAARVPEEYYPLATTQEHWSMEGRPIVLHATLAEYREDPGFTAPFRGPLPSLYDPFPEEGVQWGMSIDLTLCTGCSACVVACQAENNVPVVGKDGVLNSREMHWLRIDRYFTGDPENPVVLTQPMLCQHCEKAPCEYVCPVNATVHSPDGLNEMVYNRCVGTRFCSNNCPYKVRRFNWFDYNYEKRGSTTAMVMNPDVTVRERGVMEKCTFCVQRIRRAQIDAEIAGEDIQHRGLKTACQQACPTQAIQFGALNDPDSPVTVIRRDPRSYSVLHELGTEPRVKYAARISNPNPALVLDGAGEPHPPVGEEI
jgi:MoCo/4Fe-4S cofactor protein with predicted Tat translocation signal